MKIVYFLSGGEAEEELRTVLKEQGIAFVSVRCPDWNRDLSPWPAKRVFRGGEDFAGGAEAFLRKLTEEILPREEAALGAAEPQRYLAGYSLAGLFAVFAATKTDAFTGIASMSGSLWFEGFTEYLESHPFSRRLRRACFSLGDREAETRNERMRSVRKCTEKTVEILRSRGIPVTYRLNPGGHFQDVPERIREGILELVNGDPEI